jgi:hypothetical protein
VNSYNKNGNSNMHILSSFTLSHLQTPLEHLLNKFYSRKLTLQYTSTNLAISISSFATHIKNQPLVIFFRILDLLPGFNIEKTTEKNEVFFKKSLKDFIKLIINFDKTKEEPFIVVLCPSLYKKNS